VHHQLLPREQHRPLTYSFIHYSIN
jgi:hypothetical protein